MKPISETLKELGIAFSLPIEIIDANGKQTYYESSDGYWERTERDSKETYYENSEGVKIGTPRSAKTLEGRVVEVDGIKYELTEL
jgi:hypothetical protein